jgi:hypothetical protein
VVISDKHNPGGDGSRGRKNIFGAPGTATVYMRWTRDGAERGHRHCGGSFNGWHRLQIGYTISNP